MPNARAPDTIPPPPEIRAFADELAHEIRTPLAQIRMTVETLLAGRIASETDREHALESIDREAERLGDLTESLLLVLRDADRIDYPVRRPLDLGTLLEDALAGRVGAGSLHLDPPPGFLVAAEPAALRLAFANLADEALARAAGRGAQIRITADGGDVLVDFRSMGTGCTDRGIGAGSADAGFRLVVAERIVRAHDGTLAIAPDGEEIRVQLPLVSTVADTVGKLTVGESIGTRPSSR